MPNTFVGMRHATCPHCGRWEFHSVHRSEAGVEYWQCQECSTIWKNVPEEARK